MEAHGSVWPPLRVQQPILPCKHNLHPTSQEETSNILCLSHDSLVVTSRSREFCFLHRNLPIALNGHGGCMPQAPPPRFRKSGRAERRDDVYDKHDSTHRRERQAPHEVWRKKSPNPCHGVGGRVSCGPYFRRKNLGGCYPRDAASHHLADPCPKGYAYEEGPTPSVGQEAEEGEADAPNNVGKDLRGDAPDPVDQQHNNGSPH
mmetsp:Transcript_36266/g.74054  ORF Transcript_36266/g.74054 Transcript_36266/m.74054 type:complete len:204 (+) Transcript_36266:308-919(+)